MRCVEGWNSAERKESNNRKRKGGIRSAKKFVFAVGVRKGGFKQVRRVGCVVP